MEVELLGMGVRMLSPKVADRYRAALAADPQLVELIAAYTRLVARLKEKREVELEMLTTCRQAQSIEKKMLKVEVEYEQAKAGRRRLRWMGE